MFAAKQLFGSGTSSLNESDVDATTAYQVIDDIDAAAGTKVSFVVSSRSADGGTLEQQCVIESNGGECTGQASIGPSAAVQIDMDVTGGDASVGISGQG